MVTKREIYPDSASGNIKLDDAHDCPSADTTENRNTFYGILLGLWGGMNTYNSAVEPTKTSHNGIIFISTAQADQMMTSIDMFLRSLKFMYD